MRVWLLVVAVAAAVLASCGGRGDGLPTSSGEYVVKSKSISFDGERYLFQWAPTGRSDLSWAKTREVRLQLDDRTYLQVEADKKAVLHLTQEEPVTVVRGEGNQQTSAAWYPYYPSTTTVIVERQPIYVYPPSSSFNSGETLTGGVRSDRSVDAAQIQKLQATSNTVSGQSGGTGGGSAVLNRTGGAAPAGATTGSAAPVGATTGAGAPAPTAAVPSISTTGGAARPTTPPAPPPSQTKVPSISTKK